MRITHSGDFQVARSPQEVFDFLSDPEKLAPLLPDFKGLEKSDDAYVIKLAVGVSHIRGTATIKLKLDDNQPHHKASYIGNGSMAGGSINLNAGFELVPSDGGTRVEWIGEAQVFGRIASLARGLLQPLAKKNIQQMIDSLQAALGGGSSK